MQYGTARYWVRDLSHPKNQKNTKNINFAPRDCKNRVRSMRFTPYGFIRKELSPSVRPFSASQRAPSRPSGFKAISGAESLGTNSPRVEYMGELFIKARFTLFLSTVRRGSVSHPILCRSDCPSSVRACFGCRHVHCCATLTDSRENMYYGVAKCQCGVTARSSLSVEFCSGLG